MRRELYHGSDRLLTTEELKALQVLTGRLRAQAEQAIDGGFDLAVSEELDRLASVECELLVLIREREAEGRAA